MMNIVVCTAMLAAILFATIVSNRHLGASAVWPTAKNSAPCETDCLTAGGSTFAESAKVTSVDNDGCVAVNKTLKALRASVITLYRSNYQSGAAQKTGSSDGGTQGTTPPTCQKIVDDFVVQFGSVNTTACENVLAVKTFNQVNEVLVDQFLGADNGAQNCADAIVKIEKIVFSDTLSSSAPFLGMAWSIILVVSLPYILFCFGGR